MIPTKILCYRTGEGYSLEPEPGAEPVALECIEPLRVKRSAAGEMLVYRTGHVYGMHVEAAVRLGLVQPPA